MPTLLPSELELRGNPTKAVVDATRVRGVDQSVPNVLTRDSLDPDVRKEGMWVRTMDNGVTWELGSDLTTWSAVVIGAGDYLIDETLAGVTGTSTIHTFTDSSTGGNAVIVYDVLVTATISGGGYASFKIIATFERNSSTITLQDVTFLNGPAKSSVTYDVDFSIVGLTISMNVTGDASGSKWRASGVITVVNESFI